MRANFYISKWRQAVFAACLLLVSHAIAQPPDTLWTSELQGGGDWLDIIQTNDGGYAIGSAQEPGDERRFANMLLQKTDTLGYSEWLRFIARSDSNDRGFTTLARAIRQMPDSGYVLAGQDHYGALVVRTDINGEVLWFKTLMPEEFYISRVERCEISDDGNIVVVGEDRAVKLDDQNEGEVIWARSYDIRGGEQFWDIIKANENGYLLTGDTYSIGEGSGDIYVVRIDEEGEILWRRSYGTPYSEGCSAATLTSDSGWCLAATHQIGMGDTTYAMAVRIDANGEEIWTRVYNEYRRGNIIRSITQSADGGFVLGGNDGTASCFLLIRTDSTGEPLWRGRYPGPRGGSHSVISIMPNNDGSYTFGGYGYMGTLLIRTLPDTTNVGNEVVLLDPTFPSQFVLESPYPNPFNISVQLSYSLPTPSQISIRVYNQLGHQVTELYRGRLEVGQHSMTWNAAGLPTGVYLCRLEARTFNRTTKLILVR